MEAGPYMPYRFIHLLLSVAPSTAPDDHAGASPGAIDKLRSQVAQLFGPTFENTSLVSWITLLAGIFGGLLGGRIVQTVLRNAGDRLKARGWNIRGLVFQLSARPANLAVFSIGLSIGLHALYFAERSRLEKLPNKLTELLLVFALAWFLYNLVEIIEAAIRKITADITIILLVRKTLRILLLIVFGLFVVQNIFEQEITAWLAGLGIAGLAVSLAAQDSIKNLFGSITVLISRPFGVGDRIIFGAYDGTVENISFRDTKIRTAAGHLVTIPNMKFTDGTIENISARPFLSRTMNIGIAYDTPPRKVEEALRIIKSILSEPEIAEPVNFSERPPRVHFTEFQADSLNIAVTYAYNVKAEGRDWWTYQEHAEAINLKVFKALNDAGIEMAFRTHTVYLASDPKRPVSINVLAEAQESPSSS